MFSTPHAVWVQWYFLGIPNVSSDLVDVEKFMLGLGGVQYHEGPSRKYLVNWRLQPTHFFMSAKRNFRGDVCQAPRVRCDRLVGL